MAGRIPKHFIDELMTRVDIVDVIDAYVPLKKGGRDYSARCPFHDEKSPSFTVSADKQFYHCFGCGAHGTALGFLMEYDHMGFVDAVQDLASRVGMEVPTENVSGQFEKADETAPLYAVLEAAAAYFCRQLREHAQGSEAIEYLKNRGLTGETVAQYGIGYAPAGWDNLLNEYGKDEASKNKLLAAGLLIRKDAGGYYDRFRHRIMFPIKDRRGRVIGFGGRVLGDESPKYLNSPETAVFHKGQELYGCYEARKALRKIERLLVVEGYMDTVMLARHDINYAVATLGTATTVTHLERLFRLTVEVVFCFDGDRAGRDAAWRAMENALPLMSEGRQAKFLFLPDGEDPDSFVQKVGSTHFEEAVTQAVPLSEFFFDALSKQVDMDSIDGRARLVELARADLLKLPQGVFRHLMLNKMAALARLDRAILDDLLGIKGAGGAGQAARLAVARKAKSKSGSREPSLVRKAISLLLMSPHLAASAGDVSDFKGLEMPGVALLVQILELLQQSPHLNTGALLEHWRNDENGRYLYKLAQQENLISVEALEQEFLHTVSKLRQRYAEQRLEYLYSKLFSELSDSEKEELKQQHMVGT